MRILRIISIGDIHGRDYWKEINISKYDYIVFVGDYVDQFPPITDTEIQNNLMEIIQLKIDYPDKVILLLGNHDIQYLFPDDGYGCSGFRPSMAANLNMIFKHHKDLFQVAFQIENYLWTHAGVTKGWLRMNQEYVDEIAKKFDTVNLADTFNHMLWLKENRYLHLVSKNRGGAYIYGGITWADKKETSIDYIEGYHQIVGHTLINEITKYGDEHGSIRYIDVLNRVSWIRERDRLDMKFGNGTDYDKELLLQYPELNDGIKESDFTKFYEFELKIK